MFNGPNWYNYSVWASYSLSVLNRSIPLSSPLSPGGGLISLVFFMGSLSFRFDQWEDLK